METAKTSTPLTATRSQQWADEQAQFEASGLTVRLFCRQNKRGVSAFYQRRAVIRELGHPGLRPRQAARPKSAVGAAATVAPTAGGFVDAGVLEPSRRASSSDGRRSDHKRADDKRSGKTEVMWAAPTAPTTTPPSGLCEQDTACDVACDETTNTSVELRIKQCLNALNGVLGGLVHCRNLHQLLKHLATV